MCLVHDGLGSGLATSLYRNLRARFFTSLNQCTTCTARGRMLRCNQRCCCTRAAAAATNGRVALAATRIRRVLSRARPRRTQGKRGDKRGREDERSPGRLGKRKTKHAKPRRGRARLVSSAVETGGQSRAVARRAVFRIGRRASCRRLNSREQIMGPQRLTRHSAAWYVPCALLRIRAFFNRSTASPARASTGPRTSGASCATI